ncbi:MAG: hypothetical protein AB1611_07220 [bacterium]
MEKRDLEKMTITKLRDEALKYKDQISGTIHEMEKDQLVHALMNVLGIHEEEHAIAAKKKAKIKRSKESLKQEMRARRKDQDEARKSNDAVKVSRLRKRIKTLKRKIRKYPRAAA